MFPRCNKSGPETPGDWFRGYRARDSNLGLLSLLALFPSQRHTASPLILPAVLQSCPALCSPMDCSLPGSSVHGILQARILEWACHALLQESFLPQGLNLCLLNCRWILYPLSHSCGSPILNRKITIKKHRNGENVAQYTGHEKDPCS